MSLSRLATVELQLIMHGLDVKSLLALARCSRFTLAAASIRFAWQRIGPLAFFTAVPALGDRLRGSLLRHCAIALKMVSFAESGRPSTSGWNVELARMCDVERLASLDLFSKRHSMPAPQVHQLLAHPCVAGITTLDAGELLLDEEAVRLLGRLPVLRSVNLRPSTASLRGKRGATIDLRPMRALTALTLDFNAVYPRPFMLEAPAGLQSLELHWLPHMAVASLLCSPSLVRLTSLTISNLSAAQGGDMTGWAACLRSLAALHTLELRGLTDLEYVAAGLCSLGPSLHLRVLRLCTSCRQWINSSERYDRLLAMLPTVLESTPVTFAVELRLPSAAEMQQAAANYSRGWLVPVAVELCAAARANWNAIAHEQHFRARLLQE